MESIERNREYGHDFDLEYLTSFGNEVDDCVCSTSLNPYVYHKCLDMLYIQLQKS